MSATDSVIAGVVGITLAAAGFGAGYAWGHHEGEVDGKTTLTAAVNTKTETVQKAETKVLAAADEKQVVIQEKIRTVYKDRIQYITKEIPHEVIVRENAGCAVVPQFFVGLWNGANRGGVVPTSGSLVDESPSGVVLPDITAQHEAESELCIANTEQLKGLIAALKAQAAVKSGKVPAGVD